VEKTAEETPYTATRGRVELRWLEGRDRSVVEGLWKFILTKAGLVGGKGAQ
jgi:hypothetical protein